MPPALDVEHLTVSTGSAVLTHGISFQIEVGERVALLGASGSGKSLTAAAILGSLPVGFASSGSISLFGDPLSSGNGGRTGKVAAIYQDSASALNPLVTVGHQLTAGLRAHSPMGRREAAGTVERLLDSVGIDDPEQVMRGFASELSGGQRQRVCISLALLCGARLLVADEPTTALDVVNQARVLAVLRDHGDVAGAAILFITHDLAAASSLCDRAIVLEAGRVVETNAMSSIVSSPSHPYTSALVAAASQSVVRYRHAA